VSGLEEVWKPFHTSEFVGESGLEWIREWIRDRMRREQSIGCIVDVETCWGRLNAIATSKLVNSDEFTSLTS